MTVSSVSYISNNSQNTLNTPNVPAESIPIIDARTGQPISEEQFKEFSAQRVGVSAKDANKAFKLLEEFMGKYANKTKKPPNPDKIEKNIDMILDTLNINPKKEADNKKNSKIDKLG